MAPIPQPWTCPSCETRLETAFCPDCGERPVGPPDFTFKGIAAQVLKAVGGVDSRFLRSLRALLGRPGSLTEAYRKGRRKPFVGPFQLFLIANVIFFTVQSLTHTKIFSSSLDSHLHRQDWSALAQQLVARRLDATHTTLDRYAPLFDQAAVLNAKSLVVLMVLPLALILPILFRGSRRPFGIHVVFSLHLYAFLLLFFCISLVIENVSVRFAGVGLESARLDNALTLFNMTACAIYIFAASGRVYAARGATRLLKALGLTVAVGAVLLGYRFTMFLFTLYTA